MSYSTAISDGYEFGKAGQWGPEGIIDAYGNALSGAVVTVYYSDTTTLATLYADIDKTAGSNPVTVDGDGNLTFFALPGTYYISVASNGVVVHTDEVIVYPHPEELADNDEQLATNTAAIATLNSADYSTQINALDTRLTTAETNITGNDTDISALDSRLTTAEADIDTNTADIATNTANIATNTTNIATNTSDIATNTTNIATNTSDIATHTHSATTQYVNTVGATGATETISFDTEVHDLTMDQACTFSFSDAAASGTASSTTVIVRGAFTPTWPASVDWPGGTEPTYATPTVYTFMTVDGGTTVLGFAAGTGMA